MTIKEMEAVDLRVAIEVMKWSDKPTEKGRCPDYKIGQHGELLTIRGSSYAEGWRRYHPTGDLRYAWPIAERLGLSIVHSEDGYYAICPSDIEHHRISGTDRNSIVLIGEDGEIWLPSETVELAICQCALKLAAEGRLSRST